MWCGLATNAVAESVPATGVSLNRVAGIALSEVQRATAGASTNTATVGRSGGVLFVHRFGATLNAHVHLHLCMLDGVVAQGRQGLAFRGAQVDEACVQRVQGLAWSGDWCGVPNPDCRQCACFARSAHQISANAEQMRSLTRRQWLVGVSTKWYLPSVTSGYILVGWIWA